MVRESRPADEVGFQAFQLLVSFILTLPLAAHWVAIWLGWRIFFLADPHIQVVWATILQAAGAWPFVRGALRGRGGRRWFDGLVTFASWGLYGYGLFLTLRHAEVVTHPYFQIQAVIITTVTLDRLVGAMLSRRRVHTH
ncbi:MAG TPA: hypothetical protein VD969_07420 [Symbiobacteriaceae bacterium]|nr:hypothetical protein [Symbiobacteriaceae bacterium]